MSDFKFTTGDFVVYPAHGVGKLVGSETHEISGHKLELLVINFDKERMTLRLPSHKAKAAGLRPLSSEDAMQSALHTLTVKTKQKRAMWSRRAQEYETKINSGDPKSIAEVVRELYRAQSDSDQSYSERQIYQAAMERLARELAAVESIEETAAVVKMEKILEAA
ncbi:CarD family transcriptional regulator [Candidatus Finniella inopinata]|uniref:CarD family transcriptional regulator n=1 Tax=Candidatus Finniella inopinata TaxID=1696036 RepID=A0A4Q7DKZ7_9PROT|nr:CarD family transcriptional regulator [Candidatus Finniella inopinata]RZI46905.1 CarD family transcriptional regulator [Candidatus Finniella inopinata]